MTQPVPMTELWRGPLLESLHQTRELDSRAREQRQRLDRLQAQLQQEDNRRKRGVVALLLFGAAAATALPDGLQQLSNWPLLSWGMIGLGLLLLWPRPRV